MSKGQETRREIVHKAAALFNQKGYEGTALSDLMKATGLQKGGIYRHFGSKEQLAAEAFDYAWKTAVDIRQAGVEQCTNSLDRLRQMVRNFVEQREGLVPGGCPLLNTAIEADDGNPVLRGRARKAMKSWLARLRSVAMQGIRRGEINPRVEPEKLANLIVATLEGALMISRLERTRQPLRWAQQELEEHLEKQRIHRVQRRSA
jgi:TetR/AcrR family transcriptional regulator, transcriptional repressor for nem operon